MRPNLKALPLFLTELWQAEINKQENRKVSKQTSKNNNPSNQIYMCYLEECFQNVGLLSLFWKNDLKIYARKQRNKLAEIKTPPGISLNTNSVTLPNSGKCQLGQPSDIRNGY